ncbi:MATE efflux family protein FRD3 [Hibiscus syriacus]|uniref:Protein DETOXIFICATION n=1 Tax=Hibiscus syriacus TaxID=106335 RepID=A0A6A3CHU5_HIBSY|nr:protein DETOXIFICATION 43-like [Hibiscus syriacus]KAE8728995.1 MATE efflux family protein FRD3 [Hibiscus syriacus]
MAENGIMHPPESKWSPWGVPIFFLFKDASLVFKLDSLGLEILRIALPAALALAADPIASLIDTAFIGRIGPVELAAVGVSIAIFNQASRITIFPLVSITTSFVAEEDTLAKINPEAAKFENLENNGAKHKESETDDVEAANMENVDTKEPEDAKTLSLIDTKTETAQVKKGKRHIPSVSTALILGSMLGLLQAICLVFGAKPLLGVMGVKHGSPMLSPALKYLTLRSLGAPAVLLSLAMQGVFRGFKDTKTPLYATVAGDLTNIVLDPIFIFVLKLGVSGAAIAHILSQYLISLILLWRLMKQVSLLPPNMKDLQFGRFLKNGILLLARVIAVTFCVTLAASMAARLGPTPMAAFQICLQVWMTSSLLADGLAVAGQAILACAFAEKDYKKVTATACRVMQMSFVLGVGLAVVVGLGLYFGSGIFSKDATVLHIIAIGVPFVAATQPINSIAFVLDGVNYGASDFAFTAYSMILVAGASIASLFILSKTNGFVGIWAALTIYMALRSLASVWRIGTGTGPWRFLRGTSIA